MASGFALGTVGGIQARGLGGIVLDAVAPLGSATTAEAAGQSALAHFREGPPAANLVAEPLNPGAAAFASRIFGGIAFPLTPAWSALLRMRVVILNGTVSTRPKCLRFNPWLDIPGCTPKGKPFGSPSRGNGKCKAGVPG